MTTRKFAKYGFEKVSFNSAEEMLEQIVDNGQDFYCPTSELYVFVYNDDGSICCYNLDDYAVDKLINEQKETNEYWGGLLGWGGHIIDSPEYEDYKEGNQTPIDFCKAAYKNVWFNVTRAIN